MISLQTLEDISLLAEAEELECKLAAGRDGNGQIPNDLWLTYSAFANTRGGVIILGVKEVDRKFQLVGLRNAEKMRSDIFNLLNNRQKVSANLLDGSKVQTATIDDRCILILDVPRAGRKHQPVFINGNPLTGTYRRSDEGDRLCDGEMVRRMLAEQVEDSRDNRILVGFDIDDLSRDSIQAYRQAMRDRTPNHPFLDAENEAFLRKIGAIGRSRETGAQGLTVAGLLMFGHDTAIREEFPNYHLDFQERPRLHAELRWVDRVTLDGTWSGNVYDFYRRVYRKLVSELKVPFALKDGQRQDETPVHQALREAFVNTLVHADYTARASVLIVKRPDMFGFRNPGLMRVSIEQAFTGGESDGRNRMLQSMFLLVGAGEKAGSGVPKIQKGWRDQHWSPPSLYDLDEPSEQTRLELRMSDLIPADAKRQLQAQFGDRLESLSTDQRLILAAAAMEQVVTHARLLSICEQHRVDLSRMLQGLVKDGYLRRYGRGRATYYHLPGAGLSASENLFGTSIPAPLKVSASKPMEQTANPMEFDSVGLARNSVGLRDISREEVNDHNCIIDRLEEIDSYLREDLERLASRVTRSGKISSDVAQDVIVQLCSGRYLTLRVLSELLSRNSTYLRNSLLNPLVQSGRLKRAFSQSNDPRQAYTSTTNQSV